MKHYGNEFSTRRGVSDVSIEKRNCRERHRVQVINKAFNDLRLAIPSIAYRNKRISKVKTLLKAIEYIVEMEQMLNLFD